MAENIFHGTNMDRITDYFTFADLCLKVNCKRKLCDVINYLKRFFYFDNAVCGLVGLTDGVFSNRLEIVNVSYPEQWLRLYVENNYHMIDPVIVYHLKQFAPQVWSTTYEKTKNIGSTFISTAKDFGLVDGVCHGIFDELNTQGSIFSFSVKSISNRALILKQLELIVPLLHIALCNYHNHKKERKLLVKRKACTPLTNREKEVLNWIKIGKTNWEISMILGISERTVKFHVINILHKLNTSSRSHAVAKAINLSIIEF
jgi:LuxR family transcriptional regulator, quorum-sensing system regulator CviR